MFFSDHPLLEVSIFFLHRPKSIMSIESYKHRILLYLFLPLFIGTTSSVPDLVFQVHPIRFLKSKVGCLVLLIKSRLTLR